MKHIEPAWIYVPGSENLLQMIEDCDEEVISIFQKISDSQEPTNNDIDNAIYSWKNIQLNILIWWTLLKNKIFKRWNKTIFQDRYLPFQS